MVSIPAARFEGSVALRDGRRLGYAEYGPTTGCPVVWLHGTPGARGQIAPAAREAAYTRGIRIIAVERPGIGDSTPHRYDAVRDFASDIEQLCDALELERLAVCGLSGGGPYALACAHQLHSRVFAVAVLGGVAPAVGEEAISGGPSELARFFSPVLAQTSRPVGAFTRVLVQALQPFADPAIDAFASFMPPGDKRVFADPRMRKMFAEDLVKGSRVHMQAAFLDAVLFGRGWGFSIRDIAVPVHMWYGDSDNIVPIEHGEHMARLIPNAVFRRRPEEGHLGGLGASEEVLETLLEEWEREALPLAAQRRALSDATSRDR